MVLFDDMTLYNQYLLDVDLILNKLVGVIYTFKCPATVPLIPSLAKIGVPLTLFSSWYLEKIGVYLKIF